MRSSLAFADPLLEASVQQYIVSCHRTFCKVYLASNACISLVALFVLAWQRVAPDFTRRLFVQAAYAAICIGALYMLETKLDGFSGVSRLWFFVQRLCVCIRCADIRSLWFTLPGQTPFLRPAITPHYFFSTLLFPILGHCLGLPLPLYLDSLNSAAMLVLLWYANESYCRRLVPEEAWCMFGVGGFLEKFIQEHWGREGIYMNPSSPRYLITMCQAKIGIMQTCTFLIAILLGFGLEIYRRRLFLQEKGSSIPGGSCWPLGNGRILIGLVFDVVTVCVVYTMMCRGYLLYLSTLYNL
eukprot:jgi/Botrbrau1/5473/Bobra.27_1s0023.1